MNRKAICNKLDAAGIPFNEGWDTAELNLLYETHCEISQPNVRLALQRFNEELEEALIHHSPAFKAFVSAHIDQLQDQLKNAGVLC